jgi:hypothetical protein
MQPDRSNYFKEAATSLAARQFSQEICGNAGDQRDGVSVWVLRREAFGWKAASDHALVTKVVSDIPVEVGSFGCCGDQILENSGWNGEVAIDGTTAELQFEGFVGGVSRCRKQ